MLEIHRLRHVHWLPTAIVALATSPDGTAIAAARESGAIELWKAAPGSVGWYCQLTIPGMRGAAISCLIWCASASSPQGRLFSSALDGFITEWDLQKLEMKGQVESFGGSVWQIAARPVQSSVTRKAGEMSKIEESSDSDSEGENEAGPAASVEQQQEEIAAACDDGSVRLFTVNDSADGLSYRKAFPSVKGRILSVTWSFDGKRVFAGGSDGCIRCWDPARSYEVYRITAGIGGLERSEELCVWSLLALKCGTLVSGDSTGSTQFWDQRGTLLEALRHHKADVLALAAVPSQEAVVAAGADGQVILYKVVRQSKRLSGKGHSKPDAATGLGDKWTYIGSKRAHTHDVRALTLAVPVPFDEGDPSSKPWVRPHKERSKWPEPDHRKWARPGIPMVVSGGNDAKLFAYPANEMMSYQPHDICPAPERTLVQLAPGLSKDGNVVMMAQHSTYIDVWRVASSSSAAQNGSLRKRKRDGSEGVSNGDLTEEVKVDSEELPQGEIEVGSKSGSRPILLAKVKTKGPGHIFCSAFSGNGRYLAFSDRSKPRLFELEHGNKQWIIKRKRLRSNIPAAHQMIFSVDSSKLILACAQSEILVFDIQASEVLHVLKLEDTEHSPVTLLSASPDGQWLAVGTSTGGLIILNLETLRHHWSVPLIDGTPATAACFHSGSGGVLIVTTAANKIHVLDIERRELGMWSKVNQSNIPSEILEFPGGISGLTVSPSAEATEIIAYSSRAMCLIDFSKPVVQQEAQQEGNGHLQNGHGKANGKQSQGKKNFVLSPFKNPVLFVEYLSEKSVLVVERPWLEVLQQLPAPVFRHRYGT